MKKVLVLLMVFAASCAYAQTPADSNVVQNYTKEELQKMTKTQLTSIYMGEITEMLAYAPEAALQPGDMPDNKYLAKELKKINKSVMANAVVLKSNYKDIIPYADKANIIEAILYLQGVNNYLHML
jgi:hypothetical protein